MGLEDADDANFLRMALLRTSFSRNSPCTFSDSDLAEEKDAKENRWCATVPDDDDDDDVLPCDGNFELEDKEDRDDNDDDNEDIFLVLDDIR